MTQKSKLDAVFEAGYSAFVCGGFNPYLPFSDEYDRWKKGYDEAYYVADRGSYMELGDQ